MAGQCILNPDGGDVRRLEQALLATLALSGSSACACRAPFFVRLDTLRQLGHRLGYGVGDDMDDLLARHAVEP